MLIDSFNQDLPASPNSRSSYPHITEEKSPKDGKYSPDTYYCVQREIRTTAVLGEGPYCVNQLEFEHYQISRTEIIRSVVGLRLLETWLGLDPGCSADERRQQLVDQLRNGYCTQYASLCLSAIQQDQALDGWVHTWFFTKVRDLRGVILEHENMCEY